MKIQVTGVSVSKKGTVWIQAKLLSPEIPRTDSFFECEEVNEEESKEGETSEEE